MRKFWTLFLAVGLAVVLSSGLAQAYDYREGYLQNPILGYDSSYDGDVFIRTGPGTLINIPHDSLTSAGGEYGLSTITGMTEFTVGQTVHTGSGIYLDAGETWTFQTNWYFGGNVVAGDSAPFVSDGFWMTWNTPVGGGDGTGLGRALTDADVGSWVYEEYYWSSPAQFLSRTPFTVTAVPEPATMLLLGSGLVGLAGYARRKFKK